MIVLHYLYILRGVDSRKSYVGQTSDLKQRLHEHNSGHNTSTKHEQWQLVYYESYLTKSQAIDRESKLKNHGKGLQELKKRIGFDD
jgi:predicted GIY-YIG superfamily endonuclease